MRNFAKLMFAALAATALLGLAVSSASANHLSTNERGFRITWSSLEFVSGIGPIVRCPVTLEGAFESATINKTANASIGAVRTTSLPSASCTGGHSTILIETLPWAISYESFTGTLPNITGIKLLLLKPAFRIEASGLSCLAALRRIFGIIIGPIVSGQFKPQELNPESETFACGLAPAAKLVGEGRVTKAGSTERILITLI